MIIFITVLLCQLCYDCVTAYNVNMNEIISLLLSNFCVQLNKMFVISYFASFRYIPVLMAQSKIYWDMENYAQVEKIFRKSVEFCNENDIWKLNVAHVLFMQENKFKEATGFYEPIVKKHYDNVSK